MVWLTLIKEQVSWTNSWYPSPAPTPRALPSISPQRRGESGEAYFTPSWCRPYFNDRKKGWADMNSRERTEVDFNLDEEPRALSHFLFSMGCGRGRPTSAELLQGGCRSRRMNVIKYANQEYTHSFLCLMHWQQLNLMSQESDLKIMLLTNQCILFISFKQMIYIWVKGG